MSQPQGDRIRALLKKYGLTQAKAAEIVGVDPRTVRRWLAPEDAPTFNKIGPCCERLLAYAGRTYKNNLERDRSKK